MAGDHPGQVSMLIEGQPKVRMAQLSMVLYMKSSHCTCGALNSKWSAALALADIQCCQAIDQLHPATLLRNFLLCLMQGAQLSAVEEWQGSNATGRIA